MNMYEKVVMYIGRTRRFRRGAPGAGRRRLCGRAEIENEQSCNLEVRRDVTETTTRRGRWVAQVA